MLRTFDDIYETMPWDAVDAVVFDVGQVLLSYNPQEILDEHVPDRPDLHPILLEKIFRSPLLADARPRADDPRRGD